MPAVVCGRRVEPSMPGRAGSVAGVLWPRLRSGADRRRAAAAHAHRADPRALAGRRRARVSRPDPRDGDPLRPARGQQPRRPRRPVRTVGLRPRERSHRGRLGRSGGGRSRRDRGAHGPRGLRPERAAREGAQAGTRAAPARPQRPHLRDVHRPVRLRLRRDRRCRPAHVAGIRRAHHARHVRRRRHRRRRRPRVVLGLHARRPEPLHRRPRAAARQHRHDLRAERAAAWRVDLCRAHPRHDRGGIGARSLLVAGPAQPVHLQLLVGR